MRKRIPSGGVLTNLHERVLLSSAGLSTTTAGALASTAWLRKRGLTPPYDRAWRVELGLQTESESSAFTIEIAHDEWGFRFTHGQQSSWIRIKSLPFIYDRDDFWLLTRTPPLREISTFVRLIEHEHQLSFSRRRVSVATDLPNVEREARAWAASL